MSTTRNNSEGKGRRRQWKEPRKTTEKLAPVDSRKSAKKSTDISETRKSAEKPDDTQDRKFGKSVDAAESRKSAGKTNDPHESRKKSVDSQESKQTTGKSKESPDSRKLSNDLKSNSLKPKREVERIFGITDQRGKLEFSIKFKRQDDVELIPTAVANVEYPQEVIKFYEDRLVWKTETK